MCFNRRAREQVEPENGVYTNISTVKEYRGPDRALPPDVEYTIKTFIQDCERIGMPRCQSRCANDIHNYLKKEKIQSKYFVDDKPGNILTFITTTCKSKMYYSVKSTTLIRLNN